MNKHIFEIKDFTATKESAEHIINDQLNIIVKSVEDLEIAGINVFVNSSKIEYYDEQIDIGIPIKFIPTLIDKGKKNISKQSFAAFHNFVINNVSNEFSNHDLYIHIIDGAIDLIDSSAEVRNVKTRLGETIIDITDMMNLLNYPVWFNTASDKGNYKFNHYYTIIDLLNFDEEFKIESFPECIMYSGNTNLDWIIINTSLYDYKTMPSLIMNGNYDYDFLSIKQLIAKFANYGNGYFDAMFPTVPTEVGAYFRNINFDRDLQKYDMSKYKDNIKRYTENVKEYKHLKHSVIFDAIKYIRTIALSKLTDNDKALLNKISTGE